MSWQYSYPEELLGGWWTESVWDDLRLKSVTQISPLCYDTFGREMGGKGDEEEEEKPGGEDKTTYIGNTKYEPPILRDLVGAFWVHNSQYILPQGFILQSLGKIMFTLLM